MPKSFITNENQGLINYTGAEINFALLASDVSSGYSLSKSYEHSLKSLTPGLSIFLIHPAFDNLEMQGVSAFAGPDFGSKWRQEDFDFFTGDLCRQIIREEDIKLVAWKEIGKAFIMNNVIESIK